MLMGLADFLVMMLLQLQAEIRELYHRAVGPATDNTMNSKGYTEESHWVQSHDIYAKCLTQMVDVNLTAV